MSYIKKMNSFPIISRKHDGSFHRKWEENIALHYLDGILIGGNFRTVVTERNGNIWRTTEPAIFYFQEDSWFNIILILQEKNYYYYCNISSPFKFAQNSLMYIDYDIDVIAQADGTYEIIDREEYEKHGEQFNYSIDLKKNIEAGLDELIKKIQTKADPFNDAFYETWLEKFTPYVQSKNEHFF